jgi:hypothetical protein
MRPSILLIVAIAAVLCGAPSTTSASGTRAAARLAAQPASGPAADAAPAPGGPTIEPFQVAIGIGGIAALALIAWYALLPARRRRVDSGPPERRDGPPASRTSTDEQVTAALHRRTLRRGHVRLEEDPIIASMGVGSNSRAAAGVRRARRSARRSPPT